MSTVWHIPADFWQKIEKISKQNVTRFPDYAEVLQNLKVPFYRSLMFF